MSMLRAPNVARSVPASRAVASCRAPARAERRERAAREGPSRGYGRYAPCALQGAPCWLAARGARGGASQHWRGWTPRLPPSACLRRAGFARYPGSALPTVAWGRRNRACGPRPPPLGVKIDSGGRLCRPPFADPFLALLGRGIGRPDGLPLSSSFASFAALPTLRTRAVRIARFGRLRLPALPSAHDALRP